MKRSKYISDEKKEPHTLSISFRRTGFRDRIALMHTGSPRLFPFQISVGPEGA